MNLCQSNMITTIWTEQYSERELCTEKLLKNNEHSHYFLDIFDIDRSLAIIP